MLRRKRTEVHVNQERWLVSYADFITLLFAFFVVMYSISQVNQSKYRVLSETFEHTFSAPVKKFPDGTRSSIDQMTTENSSALSETDLAYTVSTDDINNNQHPEQRDEFAEISELFAERFGDLIADKLVHLASNELWLQIELKDSILFSSGSVAPSLQAQAIFDEIAHILKDYPNPIQVEGYTDNLPINSPRFPSNWELSAARASAIVKWLAGKGVAPTRLSAVGFGEYQPIADNDTADGRAQNRRVVLMIARKAQARPVSAATSVVATAHKIPPSTTGASTMSSLSKAAAEVSEFNNQVSSKATSATRVSSAVSLSSAASFSSVASLNNMASELSQAKRSSSPSESVTEAITPEVLAPDTLTPIELENGGLLFTSDPDLLRNGR